MTRTWIAAVWMLMAAPLAFAQTDEPYSEHQNQSGRTVEDRAAIDDSPASQERQQEDQEGYREQQARAEHHESEDAFRADREEIGARGNANRDDRYEREQADDAAEERDDVDEERSASRSATRRSFERPMLERRSEGGPVRDALAEWWSEWWSNQQSGEQGIEASNAGEFISEHDSDEDGYLSWSELPRDLRGNFNALDRDGDGYLSQRELSQHAARQARPRIPMEVTYIWVIGADRGRVDLGELQQAYTMLRRIDDDGDGYISRRELHDQQQRVVSQWINHCFDRHDQDYSDSITRQEAAGSMLARGFDHLDQNRDDELTRGELRTAMRQQQAAFEAATETAQPQSTESAGRRAASDEWDDARR